MHHSARAFAFGLLVLTILQASDAACAAASYRFIYRPPQVDQTMTHDVRFAIDATISIEQAGQQVDSRRYAVDRRQRRRITILETAPQWVQKAKVHYEAAEQTTQPRGEKKDAAAAGKTKVTQPVVDRTYVVYRSAGKLLVEDEDGKRPTDEEVALVSANMDAIGRPNPLAKFFDGRTIEVGQSVDLPRQLAGDLFGLDETVGRVSRFSMKLAKVEQVQGALCGSFETTMEMSSGEQEKKNEIRGNMVIQIDGCRAVSVDLGGPINARETRPGGGKPYQVICQGKLAVSIRSEPAR